MKYFLKQNKEDKGILCDKVTIDGFDYYESIIKTPSKKGDYSIEFLLYDDDLYVKKHEISGNKIKKIIATNKPNIDIPKVVDEVEMLGEEETNIRILQHKTPSQIARQYFDGLITGYNKSQETHPNSNEDMKDFGYFCVKHYKEKVLPKKSFDELFQLWKEQQPKVVYYVST